MADSISREPMLDMFIFETLQLLDQLEQSLISSEKESGFESSIDEIFRIMHTIKGSAAMMLFDDISKLAHSIEDMFFYLREEKPGNINSTEITDIVLNGVDFIKNETAKLENGQEPDGDATDLIKEIRDYLSNLKSINNDGNNPINSDLHNTPEIEKDQKYYISSNSGAATPKSHKYEAILKFEDECGMENIRAFSVIHDLKEIADVNCFYPEDVIEGGGKSENSEIIRKEGFRVVFSTDLGLDEVRERLSHTILLKSLEVYVINEDLEDIMGEMTDNGEDEPKEQEVKNPEKDNASSDSFITLEQNEGSFDKKPLPERKSNPSGENAGASNKQSVISVNIAKLDKLMDLVGEIVISEAMVTQNPDLQGLQLDNFHKAARQLNKLTNELQDVVMSIRMVPLSMTFQKMNRIVRDMGKKLNKSIELEIIGEETEVDKNIIERISDPLIHLIRNAVDHGLEDSEERVAKGKPPAGKITLEAKNAGGDVWIFVKDDGRGLDREKILKKAREAGLIHKPENELTDKEIYSFIFMPGFSTKEKVTEFSGRGVGMDIVSNNISMVGGTIFVDSVPDNGTIISIKLPLTLAIINGMSIKVGKSRYTIPTISIKESFKVKNEAIITDSEGNEMIMVRGEVYPVLRLHRFYKIDTEIQNINDGIIVMVENDSKVICIFADELLGEQQVVVKALPKYIKKVKGIGGCTLLGDGSISLILDVAGLVEIK
ncbi:MAG TPA: chemotaxis protein CheA [Acetivibrio sp.]|uniref:chemotaxis protein CheA n=1 Tax=Acetivibrio sp. TaxID=1872092 RepID=UPI002CB5A458|nr:chemotaxis protein CheA [Acetivibrio sp.]HOM01369.1 chemotaxis protein CheA [Acetivibrio sp.]